jgi:ABC-type transport system involved in cytochrome c biogenesis ATPase subunit
MAPRARHAKGKARLNAYEQLLNEDTAQKIEQVEIYIPPGPRLGDVVVEARGLRKGYGDLLLVDDLNFTLPRGGIVGVIGPNGAGKTTLFRMITAQEKPDGGTLRLGETVQLGYVDQSRDALAPNKSVWEEISGGEDELMIGKRPVASRAYVSWFNFKGSQQQRKVGTLSGGERNRVHLAKLLQRGSNLCCWTSRPTISTWTPCGRSKRRCSITPAAPSSSATIGGSSIASPRTCSPLRATAVWSGSKATIRTTRPIGSGGLARKPTRRIASNTGN